MSCIIVVYYTHDRVAFILRTEDMRDDNVRNPRARTTLAERFPRESRCATVLPLCNNKNSCENRFAELILGCEFISTN